MHGRVVGRIVGGGPFVEPAGVAEETVRQRFGRGAGRRGHEPAGERGVVAPDEAGRVDSLPDEPHRPLQHRGGGADGMVPVDLAEHDVAGEHHQLGGGAALVGDGERRAGGVEAEACEQPLLVEVPAVRHAGVQAVAGQVVHLVNVDRPREQRAEDAAGRIVGGSLDQSGHAGRIEFPAVGEDSACGTVVKQRPHE